MARLFPGLIVSIIAFSAVFADERPPPQAAISFVGFFNSETEAFSPEPIGYGAMIDFHQAHETVNTDLKKKGFDAKPYGEFEGGFEQLDPEETERLRETIEGLLEGARTFLLTGKSPRGCTNLRLPAFSKLAAYSDWNQTSRIYTILGLEISSPSGRGLRSGLILATFDGHGICEGVSVKEYNFTNYSTEQFIADIRELILDAEDAGSSG